MQMDLGAKYYVAGFPCLLRLHGMWHSSGTVAYKHEDLMGPSMFRCFVACINASLIRSEARKVLLLEGVRTIGSGSRPMLFSTVPVTANSCLYAAASFFQPLTGL